VEEGQEMKYKNIQILISGAHYIAHHTNGKSIRFTTDSLTNRWLVARLKYFDKHGTMKGY